MKTLIGGAALAVAILFAPTGASACPGKDGAQSASAAESGSCQAAKAAAAEAGGCPHAKAAAAETGGCPHAAKASAAEAGSCPHAKAGNCAAADCPHKAKGVRAEVKTIGVDELAGLKPGVQVTILDVNNEGTRTKQGVIPGAVLLSSSSQFDPAKELPAAKDATLVFYCANERCRASHDAAKRAVEAGYSDVRVLPAGIAGWKQAGKPTVQPPT